MRNKNYSILRLSLLISTTMMITSCGHKKEYEEQIYHYIDNVPACVSIPFKPYSWSSGEMPSDKISIELSIPKTNLDDEKLIKYQSKINAMNALVKLGFFSKGKSDDVKNKFFGTENVSVTYIVTDLGLKQFDKSDDGKPIFGKLCFGTFKVDNISEPVGITFGSLTGETINYNWTVNFSKDYAKDPSFSKEFDITTKGIGSLFFAKNDSGGFIAFPIVNNQINMFNTLQLKGFNGQLNDDLSNDLFKNF